MAHPLASFVAGVQGGIQFRNSLKDRKDDKARQAKMDEITFAREARAADEYAFTQSERRRAMGLRDAQETDAAAAVAATEASLAADGTVIAPGQPDMTVSTAGTPPAAGGAPAGPATPAAAGVAQELGLKLPPPSMDRAAAVMQQTMPAESLVGQPATPAVARPGPTQAAAGRLARQAQFEPGPQQQPVSFAEWSTMTRDQRKAMGLPATMLQRDATGIFNDDSEPNSRRVLREAREESQGRTAGQALDSRIAAGGMLDSEAAAATGAAETRGIPPGSPADVQLDEIVVNQGPTKAAAAAVQARTGTAAVQAAPPAAQDAAQAGAAAATDGKGFKPDTPVTKDQRARGETAFLERYAEVGAPMVIEGYLKRGDLKGAMAYQEFIDSVSTKKAMKLYASAVFDASIGDLSGSMDKFIDLYNDNDYFQDDTSIIKDKSRIVYDQETGEPMGGVLVFKDEKTGNTWEKVLGGQDFITFGATILAPENAVGFAQEKQAAAEERQRGLQKDTLDANEKIAKMALELMKAQPTDAADQLIGPAMTFEEAQIKAAQALGLGSVAPSGPAPAGQPAPAGAPPVAYRP